MSARARSTRERGATGLEYVALIALALMVVTAILVGLVTQTDLAGRTAAAVCRVITAGEDCEAVGERVETALERALSRPEELMREIRAYTMHHEPHRDCRCSARVLDAVDDYIARGHAGLKRKPLNLIRKWKLRRQMRYYPLLEMFRR